MTIKRNNILSLIGTGRYHSCILTTFSFDFYFFEMKVMKWLRSCGVRNTNVFIDGHFYSELMQQATGDEMTYSTGYSLYPIFEKGIFHPKILMLFGEKEGLLIVGSGNLTSSGNGSNDEIWGAYHFDIKEPQNAPVIASAWKYISGITESIKGITAEKTTRWIAEHSQWLMELPDVEDFQFVDLSANESVVFLHNAKKTTIWQQIKRHIGNEKVVEITAISPYYDLHGKALETIKIEFPNARMNVVLDENGIIPSSLANNRGYSFYDWKEMNICRNIGAKQQSRLHAKILYFRTPKKEYCLFGSANITPAGLGISKNPNAEVSLFVKSNSGNLLNKIGLELIPGNAKTLSKFLVNNKASIEQEIINPNRFPIKLYAAEINYSTLTIYSSAENNIAVSVALFDYDNKLIRIEKIKALTAQQEIKLTIDEDKLRYVQIQGTEGKYLSNKIIVINYFAIAKTHPDPKNSELEKLCDQLQNGELRNVLDLIHYAIMDESEKEDGTLLPTGTRKPNRNEDKKAADESLLYDLSAYTPIKEKSNLQESALLLSPSLRVLDALKRAHSNNPDSQTDIRTDEQEENIGNINGNEEEEVKIEKNISLKLLDADKRKLKNFFKSLYNYFHHDVLFKDIKVSDYQLTLTDLTKYLIALELIHEFGGKSEKVENEQQQLFFTYLPVSGDYANDNVKGCCLNIVGDFLRLAKNGLKEYTFDYTKKKFAQLQYDALVSTIVCIINIHWNENEKPYFKTLLLNALHYLGWSSTTELEGNIHPLILKVRDKAKSLKQQTNDLESQLSYFTNQVCAAFKRSTIKRENRNFANKASKGQIIYSSIAGAGYCYVVSVNNQNEYCLARPGFDWNDNQNEYINHFGDTIYRPLPLRNITVVDI